VANRRARIDNHNTDTHFPSTELSSHDCVGYQSEFWRLNMKSHLALIGGTLGLAVILGAASAGHALAARPPASALQALDTDHDGTVDLNETRTAASALFDRLDGDRDGTLDQRELKGRLSAKQLAAADPDHDGTLTKAEYLAIVESRFRAADPDHDGTLDAKELKSPAGQTLLRLVE
jgi:Ca2+-binding EF-hand superfamily protein